MKTLQKILATILLGAACSSCDLTLIPEDTVTPQTFFKTETDLRLWTNQFYTMLESPDNAAGLNADDMVDKSMGDVISGTRTASNEKGWTWTALRKINYYLANSHNCTDEAVRTKYDVFCFLPLARPTSSAPISTTRRYSATATYPGTSRSSAPKRRSC